MIENEYPITLSEAARRLGIQRQAIYNGVKDNQINTFRVNHQSRMIRVYESEVREWNDRRFKRGSKTIEPFTVRAVTLDSCQCLNCNGARFVYNRRRNTYSECPSCNTPKELVSA